MKPSAVVHRSGMRPSFSDLESSLVTSNHRRCGKLD
jgi:hypothetical protein